MTCKRTKLLSAFLLLVVLGVCLSHWLASTPGVSAFSGGPPPSLTGAPGERTCDVCHSTYPLDDPSGGVVLEGLPEAYTPGTPIEFSVTVFQDGTGGPRLDWGFQLTALDADGAAAGTLVVTDETNTQTVEGKVKGQFRTYIQHTSEGVFFNPEGAESATWTMTWVPPDADAGPVTFYVIGIAGDGNFDPPADYVFTATQVVQGPGAKAASAP